MNPSSWCCLFLIISPPTMGQMVYSTSQYVRLNLGYDVWSPAAAAEFTDGASLSPVDCGGLCSANSDTR